MRKWIDGACQNTRKLLNRWIKNKQPEDIDSYEHRFQNAQAFREWQAEQVCRDIRKALAAEAARQF